MPGYSELKAEQLHHVWNFWQETALTWGWNCPSNAGRLSAFSALSILQEKPTAPLVPGSQRVHTAADFPVSASPVLPWGHGPSFCSASPLPGWASSSALCQSSSWSTLRTVKAVQQQEHRSSFATHSSNFILVTPSHCPQTEKYHSTRQARCETQDSKVTL